MRTPASLVACLAFLFSTPTLAQDWLPDIGDGTTEIRLQTHATGFNGFVAGIDQIIPTDLALIPDGSGRMVVATLGGLLRVIDEDGNILGGPDSIYLNTNTSQTAIAPFAYGLTSVAFHPDFANSGSGGFGKLYVLVTEAPKAENLYDFVPIVGSGNDHAALLVEYTIDASAIDSNALITSGGGQNVGRRELFVVREPDNEHNFCDLVFDEAGRLFVSAGDGLFNFNGAVNLEALNAQELETVLGKVLRIDPLGSTSSNGQYGIVNENVFASDGDANTLGEIFSYGHRNPWRLSIDHPTGRVLVGEVGHFNIEEVNICSNGNNYGWPDLEGSFLINFNNGFDLMPDIGDAFAIANGYTPPTFEYDHEDGRSVTGGFVYRGNSIPALHGKYIFGEFQGGFVAGDRRLFVGDLDTGDFQVLSLAAGSVNLGQPVSFGEDASGELYVVTLDGRILTINPIVLFGDANQDGVVNLLDIQPFVALITAGQFQLEADMNQDGAVNLLDIEPFVAILSG